MWRDLETSIVLMRRSKNLIKREYCQDISFGRLLLSFFLSVQLRCVNYTGAASNLLLVVISAFTKEINKVVKL